MFQISILYKAFGQTRSKAVMSPLTHWFNTLLGFLVTKSDRDTRQPDFTIPQAGSYSRPLRGMAGVRSQRVDAEPDVLCGPRFYDPGFLPMPVTVTA